MVIREHLYTGAEFEQFLQLPANQDRLFELIDGEIVEKVPTEEHADIIFRLSREIYIVIRQNPAVRGLVEARHQMPGDEHNAYQPDLAVPLHTDHVPVSSGVLKRMSDLAIEVKSPSNTIIGLRKKALYYLEHGSKMVWLIFPHKRLIEVYPVGQDVEVLTEDDTLTGDEVLPGFSLTVRNIFFNS